MFTCTHLRIKASGAALKGAMRTERRVDGGLKWATWIGMDGVDGGVYGLPGTHPLPPEDKEGSDELATPEEDVVDVKDPRPPRGAAGDFGDAKESEGPYAIYQRYLLSVAKDLCSDAWYGLSLAEQRTPRFPLHFDVDGKVSLELGFTTMRKGELFLTAAGHTLVSTIQEAVLDCYATLNKSALKRVGRMAVSARQAQYMWSDGDRIIREEDEAKLAGTFGPDELRKLLSKGAESSDAGGEGSVVPAVGSASVGEGVGSGAGTLPPEDSSTFEQDLNDFLDGVEVQEAFGTAERVPLAKEGIHVHFPWLIVDSARALQIYPWVRQKLQQRFPGIASPHTTPPEELIDATIMVNNGCRMLGCTKCSKCPACSTLERKLPREKHVQLDPAVRTKKDMPDMEEDVVKGRLSLCGGCYLRRIYSNSRYVVIGIYNADGSVAMSATTSMRGTKEMEWLRKAVTQVREMSKVKAGRLSWTVVEAPGHAVEVGVNVRDDLSRHVGMAFAHLQKNAQKAKLERVERMWRALCLFSVRRPEATRKTPGFAPPAGINPPEQPQNLAKVADLPKRSKRQAQLREFLADASPQERLELLSFKDPWAWKRVTRTPALERRVHHVMLQVARQGWPDAYGKASVRSVYGSREGLRTVRIFFRTTLPCMNRFHRCGALSFVQLTESGLVMQGCTCPGTSSHDAKFGMPCGKLKAKIETATAPAMLHGRRFGTQVDMTQAAAIVRMAHAASDVTTQHSFAPEPKTPPVQDAKASEMHQGQALHRLLLESMSEERRASGQPCMSLTEDMAQMVAIHVVGQDQHQMNRLAEMPGQRHAQAAFRQLVLGKQQELLAAVAAHNDAAAATAPDPALFGKQVDALARAAKALLEPCSAANPGSGPPGSSGSSGSPRARGAGPGCGSSTEDVAALVGTKRPGGVLKRIKT